MTDGRKIITKNRKARRDYHIRDRYDAGLVLLGSEIKSIRAHRINISDGFVQEKDRELWLLNTHIAPYEQARRFGHSDPRRPRKLLLHRREINRIISKLREQGMTAVPLQVYLERGRAKSKSGWPKASGNTTSAPISPSATPSGRLNARSKSARRRHIR